MQNDNGKRNDNQELSVRFDDNGLCECPIIAPWKKNYYSYLLWIKGIIKKFIINTYFKSKESVSALLKSSFKDNLPDTMKL